PNGTYTVDPDCTGSFFDTDGTNSNNVIVLDGGKRYFVLSEAQGTIVSEEGIRLEKKRTNGALARSEAKQGQIRRTPLKEIAFLRQCRGTRPSPNTTLASAGCEPTAAMNRRLEVNDARFTHISAI